MTHDTHSDEHHITPVSVYLKVGAALFLLTFLTIGVHAIREHIGALAPFLAFGIAAVKAYLVMAWFMHLKYDVLLNRVIFATGFLFLLLLFAITAMDIFSRTAVNSVL
jgi:cytochrome c oxidase subunit 4